MFTSIASPEAFDAFIAQHGAALIYFGGADCGVCQVLRPKVEALLEQRFPQLAAALVEAPEQPEIAGQQRVFTLPTVVIYFDGHELLRKVRNFTPTELAEELERPYGLYFG